MQIYTEIERVDPGDFDDDLRPVEDGVGQIIIMVGNQARNFLGPWHVEPTKGVHFVIYARKDEAAQQLHDACRGRGDC